MEEKHYEIGIPTIDFQHKTIIEKINKISTTKQSDQVYGKLEILINDLIDYALYHFRTEEELMIIMNFDEINEHKQIHNDFKNKLITEIENFAGNKITLFDLINFLKNWVTEHIFSEDVKLGEYIKLHPIT